LAQFYGAQAKLIFSPVQHGVSLVQFDADLIKRLSAVAVRPPQLRIIDGYAQFAPGFWHNLSTGLEYLSIRRNEAQDG
jgi:hypothetical protein